MNLRRQTAGAVLLLTAAILCAARPCAARPAAQGLASGRISGMVLDRETREPLFGANVLVRGTLLGAVSDMEGRFEIRDVPPGEAVLDVSLLGYAKKAVPRIRIAPGITETVRVELAPSVLQHETMVVTASKRRQRIEDAPTSVDVISAEDITGRSVSSLDKALENTAGFSVIDGQIDLRGSTGFNWAAGSRVLLMVDGHPLINGDTGGINWDAVPVEEVEKVEIVKGAGSALYGSNAMAGMVNVITRDPSPVPETRARLSWGFFDEPAHGQWTWTDRFLTKRISSGNWNPAHSLSFEEIDLAHSRKTGRLGLSVNASRKRSSGYFQNGDFSQWNVGAKTKMTWSKEKSLSVAGDWTVNDHGEMLQWISQSKALEVPVEELGNRIRYDKLYLHATFKNVASRSLDYTMKANWYRTHWKNYFQDNRDWARTDRFGAETQFGYIFPFLRPQTLTFGSEAVYHRSRSLIYGNPESWDAALYAEDEVKFSDWGTLTAGARFDYHDLVGVTVDNQISPRIGLVLHPTKGTSMRLSAGRGFRAPSIAEVFADISVAGIRVVPNPDLHDAEKATSAEAGVSHTWLFGFDGRDDSTRFFDAPSRWLRNRFDLRLSADASCFMSRYENMIDVDLNPELMAFQFMNYGKAAIDGFEAKADASVFGGFLSGHAGYTRLDPEDLKTHKILNYRSRHRVVAGLEIRAGQWTFGFDYRYASRIEEVVNLYSTDERVPMHVTDGRIRLDLGDVDFALEGKNLGNYSYTLRQRLLEPVRHFVLTMRIKT